MMGPGTASEYLSRLRYTSNTSGSVMASDDSATTSTAAGSVLGDANCQRTKAT